MATRQIIEIDEEKCTGCGECVPSCAEGAIQIVDGVAKLISDNLCDGLGACLGECPEGAMSIIERDADDFDEQAVEEHMSEKISEKGAGVFAAGFPKHDHGHGGMGGCPGSRVLQFSGAKGSESGSQATRETNQPSELRQWPIQLHLVPPTAPYYKKADVILAADCTAFAIGDFHRTHLKGRSLAVACPKLDQGLDIYANKLVAMIDEAEINTLSVMIMEVPCCTGLLELAKTAASRAKRKVPIKQIVVSLNGEIKREEWI